MKLYRVLFLIVFSGAIFFVGAVSDILAQQVFVEDVGVDLKGPYTAYASAKRYGGALTNGLHISLFASAYGSEFAKNSSYELIIAVPLSQWHDQKNSRLIYGGLIDGPFYDSVGEIHHRFEVNAGFTTSLVGGDDKSVSGSPPPNAPLMYIADAQANVPAMVSLPIIITPPVPEPGIGGGCSSNTPGMYALSGSYTATPGDIHEVCLITDAPYSQVYWYVKVPWDTTPGTLGTSEEIDTGDGTTKEATFSYTFPSGAMHTGTFTITAYIYRSDNTIYEESYTVTVEMVAN